MRWFRSNIRGCARLALVALAVQITLTFGHVHLDGTARASAQAVTSAAAVQAIAPSAKADDQSQKSNTPSDFDCPICALIQLASTSAPSVAPPLPIPAIVSGTVLETPNDLGSVSSPHFAFFARGPPAI